MFPTSAAAAAGGPGGDDCHQEIISDEKFFSRLLSKEPSAANPSFRVYYGGASGSVPFLWESQPGTPKHSAAGAAAAAAAAFPPLAPPPSSYSNSSHPSGKFSPKSSRLKFLHAVLPRIAPRKAPLTPPSISSSDGEENDEAKMSPTSTLCFGDRLDLKKAILAVVGFGSGSGHGSGHGPGHGGSA